MSDAQVVQPSAADPLAAAGLPLTQYLTTLAGKELLAGQKVFIYEGMIWQGFSGLCVRVEDVQLTQDELDAALDVDSTKSRVVQRNESKKRKAERIKAEEMAEIRRKRLVEAAEEKRARDLLGDAFDEVVEPEAPAAVAAPPIATATPTDAKLDVVIQSLGALTDAVRTLISAKVDTPASDPLAANVVRCEVPGCMRPVPPGKNPGSWLKSHRAACHSPRKKRRSAAAT